MHTKLIDQLSWIQMAGISILFFPISFLKYKNEKGVMDYDFLINSFLFDFDNLG